VQTAAKWATSKRTKSAPNHFLMTLPHFSKPWFLRVDPS
jgi:hypothetical protein